ncbi:hypothetical protein [Methylobacter sp. BlB1]|jgi:hypothetical protein|uniref:hypothetical protein n=1 Tax=Methylobacter sp. BlB1 TaxID=2785914 RepID=UPI00189537B6|nr:hypothetical protein [Methylobacter sp. BlB1]MBF6648033.1 hypothetical protein [Methylobacter sp. BlB1]
MRQNRVKAAEQCSICDGKFKKKPKFDFWFLFGVVRFFVNLFSLIDKYWPKIEDFFNGGPE